MTHDNDLFDDPIEQTIIQCVHAALRSRYGQIARDNQANPAGMRNRFDNEFEQWRVALAGSKTSDQFRTVFADLLSRGGPGNKPLQQAWRQILPFLSNRRWQQTRDLSLLALASYESNGPKIADEEKKS